MMSSTPDQKKATELGGLRVSVNKVEYHPELPASEDKPYPFVYFITIHNDSERTVTLLVRKWVVTDSLGHRVVVEGQGIVGHRPQLEPGQEFSYNSYHIIATDSVAEGSYHGVDDQGNHVFVRIPPFRMTVPQRTT